MDANYFTTLNDPGHQPSLQSDYSPDPNYQYPVEKNPNPSR